MNELRKKARMPRIERRPSPEIASESNQLWAVSYADVLMVLLSFFIIFFSMGHDSRESVIKKILVDELKQKGSVAQVAPAVARAPASLPSAAPGAGTGATAGGAVRQPVSAATLKSVLAESPVHSIETGDSLLLEFPDDVYAKGSSELPLKQRNRLAGVLRRLKPYLNEIEITFVGHTDAIPVRYRRSTSIHDNVDLGAARAKEALKLAERGGYPLDGMGTEAGSPFKRATRSLSIRITARRSGP